MQKGTTKRAQIVRDYEVQRFAGGVDKQGAPIMINRFLARVRPSSMKWLTGHTGLRRWMVQESRGNATDRPLL